MQPRAFSITDVLTTDEIKDLCRVRPWRGALAVAACWAMIVGLFVVAEVWPTAPVIALVVMLLGGRQLALGVLGHDAAHKALFRSRRWNDFAGVWLLDAWIWADFQGYRANHVKHHVVSGTLDDPDLGNVTPYPMSRARLAITFLKDLVGVTALFRVGNNLLSDLGFVRYSAAGQILPVDQQGRSNRDVLALIVKKMGPTILCTGLLVAACAVLGHAWLALLWVAAWVSPLQAFIRCRATQEHACVPDPAHPIHGSRTVGAPIWERLTVAPCSINFHIEHHLLMTAPFYNLPRMHRLLRERGALDGAPMERSLLATLLHVTSPGAPDAHKNPPPGPSGVAPVVEPIAPKAGPLTGSSLLPRVGELVARVALRVRTAPPV